MDLKDMKPGMRVICKLPSGETLRAQVGRAWGEGQPQTIVRFANGGMLFVRESNCGLFEPDVMLN